MSNELAINGGKALNTKPMPTWPQFDLEVLNDIRRILEQGKVNYWTGDLRIVKENLGEGDFGSIGMEFEREFARAMDARYFVSVATGTAALHTALAALGIGSGDEVIVPAYTFIASSFSVLQAGAVPVFADVERHSHCIDPKDIERKITPKTKAIIPVHLYGNMCDMDPIMEIAEKHGLLVIEDCAEAYGATYKGRKVGTIGNAGCVSFCQSKTFTTGGEGGGILTNDESLMWEMRSFRDHGYDVKERMRLLELEAKLPYIHNRVGFNYRMTEIQSAIGLRELKRLYTWNLPRRWKNGQILIDALKDIPEILYLPIHNEQNMNGFFTFPIVLDIDRLSCTIKEFIKAAGAEGISVGPVFWPQSYKEKAYVEHNGFGRLKYPFEDPNNTNIDYTKCFCENSAWLEDRTLVTWNFPSMEPEHMEIVANVLKKVIRAYGK